MEDWAPAFPSSTCADEDGRDARPLYLFDSVIRTRMKRREQLRGPRSSRKRSNANAPDH